jgi:hypothetical protein
LRLVPLASSLTFEINNAIISNTTDYEVNDFVAATATSLPQFTYTPQSTEVAI